MSTVGVVRRAGRSRLAIGSIFLETAAEAAEVVDCERTDQVNCCRSAESYSETFRDVHRGFATVTLTERDLHAGQ